MAWNPDIIAYTSDECKWLQEEQMPAEQEKVGVAHRQARRMATPDGETLCYTPETLLRPVMGKRHGQPALLISGAVQSVLWQPGMALDGYWEAMLPPICPRRALLLGLGGGTIANLLAARCPEVQMVGVERSAEVLTLARERFGLDALGNLEIVTGDALVVIDAIAGPFDYISLDLYVGGAIATGALNAPFLRTLAARLAPDGSLYANLVVTRQLERQIHRLERVFRIMERIAVKDNVVVRCGCHGRV
jgi:precorrin-6B methylase 2